VCIRDSKRLSFLNDKSKMPPQDIAWTVWPIVTAFAVWRIEEAQRQRTSPTSPEEKVTLQIQAMLLGVAVGLFLLFFSLFFV